MLQCFEDMASPLPSSPSPPSSPSSARSTESVSAPTTSSSSRKRSLRKLQPAWRSPVWEFFSVAEDTKFAQCKKCTELVARGGETTKSFNTSNLVYHLKMKHLEDFHQFLKIKETKENKRESIKKEGQGRKVSVDYVS